MRMTFEKGDKVKVKDGLKVGSKYNGIKLLEGMNHRNVMTVIERDGDTFFCNHFWYGEDMLEPADGEQEDDEQEGADFMAEVKAVMAGIKLVDCLCNVSDEAASANGYALLKALYASAERKVFYTFIKGCKDAVDEILEDEK